MLTEQEAVAKLNEKIAKSDVKQVTRRFLSKIELLQSRLAAQNAEMDELDRKKKAVEVEIQRIKGAISILLELAAEEEGMLAEVSENTDK